MGLQGLSLKKGVGIWQFLNLTSKSWAWSGNLVSIPPFCIFSKYYLHIISLIHIVALSLIVKTLLRGLNDCALYAVSPPKNCLLWNVVKIKDSCSCLYLQKTCLKSMFHCRCPILRPIICLYLSFLPNLFYFNNLVCK